MRNVLFVCYSHKEKNNLVPRSADVRCNKFSEHLSNMGYKTAVFNFNKYEYGKGPVAIITRAIGGFFRILGENSRTVLYVQKPGLAAFVTWAACLFKRNTIVLDLDDYEFKTGFGRFTFNRLVSRSKFVVCASDFLINMVKKKTVSARKLRNSKRTSAKKNIYYIPGGVEASSIKPVKASKAKNAVKLLWLGNINREASYNVKKLLDLFKEIRKKNKKIVLEIRGDGSHDAAVINKINKENIEGVKIVARQKDFNKYLAKMDIGISYLFDNSYDKSKNPGKLYTYLAAGLPVIGTAFGDNKRGIINNKNGFLTKTDNEFIKAVLKLSSSKQLRNKFSKESRKLALIHFDRRKIVKNLAKILEVELQ